MNLAAILTIGCDESRRVADVAREAADRQAAQNVELARVAAEAAGGVGRLVTADAEARRDAVRLSTEIQQERARLDQGWSSLSAERKDLDGERRRTATIAVFLKGLGVVVIAALALGLAWFVLVRDAPDLADGHAALDLLVAARDATRISDVETAPWRGESLAVSDEPLLGPLINHNPAPAPRNPQSLLPQELVAVVAAVQAILYRDVDDEDRPSWNPDKDWQGGDLLEEIAGVLDAHGLCPPDE